MFKSFCKSTTSDASFATSIAVSTEIPISASFKAEISFMPSPKNPTTCPLSFIHLTILDFCSGVSSANILFFSTISDNSASEISLISFPVKILKESIPTLVQIDFATET